MHSVSISNALTIIFCFRLSNNMSLCPLLTLQIEPKTKST